VDVIVLAGQAKGRKRETKTRKVSLSSDWREIQLRSGLKLRSKSDKANYELAVRALNQNCKWRLGYCTVGQLKDDGANSVEGLEMSRLLHSSYTDTLMYFMCVPGRTRQTETWREITTTSRRNLYADMASTLWDTAAGPLHRRPKDSSGRTYSTSIPEAAEKSKQSALENIVAKMPHSQKKHTA